MVDFSFGTSQKKETPLDRVLSLQSQGLSNDQIVQTLQGEGHKASQIFEAMRQAEIRESVGGPTSLAQIEPVQNPLGGGFGGRGYSQGGVDVNKIEEIAEAIIDEKWNVLVENVNKIIDWKERVDEQIATLNQRVQQLNQDFTKLQAAIISKTEEYDKTMKDVGTDVKALSKVFQKILPGFIENVNELSRITARMKGLPEERKSSRSTEESDDSDTAEENEDDVPQPVSPKRAKKGDIFSGSSIDDIE